MTLTVPKLRTLTFETAIIDRYRRRGSSVEEALIEMYLAGVSIRRVEDITQAVDKTVHRVDPVAFQLMPPSLSGGLRDGSGRYLVIFQAIDSFYV